MTNENNSGNIAKPKKGINKNRVIPVPNLNPYAEDNSSKIPTESVNPIRTRPTDTGRLDDDSRANRPTRIPIHKQNAISANKRAGFMRRVVTDREERINKFLQAGYSIVRDGEKIGDQRSKDPSQLSDMPRRQVGHGLYGVLMEIPEELYNQDQVDKIEQTRDVERELFRANLADPNKKQYGSVSASISNKG
jgi:hypothetical protein